MNVPWRDAGVTRSSNTMWTSWALYARAVDNDTSASYAVRASNGCCRRQWDKSRALCAPSRRSEPAVDPEFLGQRRDGERSCTSTALTSGGKIDEV